MTSHMHTCPIAFSEVNNSSYCVCDPYSLHTAAIVKRNTVVCDFDRNTAIQKAYLVYGYCIGWDNSSHINSQIIVISCPFTAGKHAVSPGTLIPKWPEELHEYCQHFNRSGRLCERCSNR